MRALLPVVIFPGEPGSALLVLLGLVALVVGLKVFGALSRLALRLLLVAFVAAVVIETLWALV